MLERGGATKGAITSLAVIVALVAAPAANADPSAKVTRFWERKSHYEFVIHRCGPRVCVVGWTRHFANSTMTAITACRVRGGRVKCRMRSAESSTMTSSEDSSAVPPARR